MTLKQNAPTVFPTLRYDDADAALAFLTDVLGLATGDLTRDAEGHITHAELGWANGVIMIGSRGSGSSDFDTGRACLYLATEDPDGGYERAVAAGAQVVMGLTDQPYGSREYAVRDPEGNVWCFGTYQPEAVPVRGEAHDRSPAATG